MWKNLTSIHSENVAMNGECDKMRRKLESLRCIVFPIENRNFVGRPRVRRSYLSAAEENIALVDPLIQLW